MPRSEQEWWAEVLSGSRYCKPAPTLVAGAVISKPYLVITTLREKAGCTTLSERTSAVLLLQDRSATALEAFSRKLRTLGGKRQMKEVYLRTNAAGGKFPGHPLNFKMEAALQLSGFAVSFVNSPDVTKWIRREEPSLPSLPKLTLGARVAGLQEKAVETAMFVRAHFDEPRRFSDGANDDEG